MIHPLAVPCVRSRKVQPLSESTMMMMMMTETDLRIISPAVILRVSQFSSAISYQSTGYEKYIWRVEKLRGLAANFLLTLFFNKIDRRQISRKAIWNELIYQLFFFPSKVPKEKKEKEIDREEYVVSKSSRKQVEFQLRT